MESNVILTRGGIYLAKLAPSKTNEVGKIRPVIILNAQAILDVVPPVIFVCPLSSQSHAAFQHLHVSVAERDNLSTKSYALIEHCRSISIKRLHFPRIAQLTTVELSLILHRLQKLVGV